MKKYGKFLILILVAILIVILVIILKNKSLNKVDIENDFGSIEYISTSSFGGERHITLSSNHELEYVIDDSEITKITLTDTEYNKFINTLKNSGIMKLKKKLGVDKDPINLTKETINIEFLNDESFERTGVDIKDYEFRAVADALENLINE